LGQRKEISVSMTLKPTGHNIYLGRKYSEFPFALPQLLGVLSLKAFPHKAISPWWRSESHTSCLSRQEDNCRVNNNCSLLLLSPSFMTWNSDVGEEEYSLSSILFRQRVALWLKHSPAVMGYTCLNWLRQKVD